MGKWVEVKPKAWSPCDGCQVGSCSTSYKVVEGKEYIKTDDCREDCKVYRDWIKAEFQLAKRV